MEPVHLERFYLGCLAHASYMVASGGVAAVIDPQRDVDIYIDTAAERGWKIEHVIETHLHADFVSGHHELAERTGARIYLGAGSGAEFPHVAVQDGDAIAFGECRLKFLQTPGHTLESMCVVMTDAGQPERPPIVFTGDTLFVGDVGRPDLSASHTAQELAAMLYASLHEKLLKLPDDTEVYPAHGAGSLCGRQLGSESSTTIGRQKQTNYALRARSVEEFIGLVTENLSSAPEYFAADVDLNRKGAPPLRELPALKALTADEVAELVASGAVVVDTRPGTDFAAAHVPGSIHIALNGQYASWAARTVGLKSTVVIVGEDAEHVRESQLRLARVGMETVAGYLDGGVTGWVKSGRELVQTPQISATELAELLSEDPAQVAVLDVREPSEFDQGAIAHAVSIPLGTLVARMGEVDREKIVAVHCKGGYRSSIAASLLQRAGFNQVVNLAGGFDAWKAEGLPCSSGAEVRG